MGNRLDAVLAIAVNHDDALIPLPQNIIEGHPHLGAQRARRKLGQQGPHAVLAEKIGSEASIRASAVRHHDVGIFCGIGLSIRGHLPKLIANPLALVNHKNRDRPAARFRREFLLSIRGNPRISAHGASC